MRVQVERWCAWAPGIEDEPAWRAWSAAPAPLPGGEGAPRIDFVPPLLRRRCDPLARMLLYVARGACPDAGLLASVPVVLASRHGPFATTVRLLDAIASSQPMSPTGFSHAVHNAALGLLSIWAGNRAPSVALAAQRDTFAQGYTEALALLQRSRAERVLFVTADEELPEIFRALPTARPGGYALALLLARSDDPAALALDLGAGGAEPDSELAWPEALEFLRWWIGSSERLRLARAPRAWTWLRGRAPAGTAAASPA